MSHRQGHPDDPVHPRLDLSTAPGADRLRSEADGAARARALLHLAFLAQSREAVRVGDGLAEVIELLADRAEVARREVRDGVQAGALLLRQGRLEEAAEEDE